MSGLQGTTKNKTQHITITANSTTFAEPAKKGGTNDKKNSKGFTPINTKEHKTVTDPFKSLLENKVTPKRVPNKAHYLHSQCIRNKQSYPDCKFEPKCSYERSKQNDSDSFNRETYGLYYSTKMSSYMGVNPSNNVKIRPVTSVNEKSYSNNKKKSFERYVYHPEVVGVPTSKTFIIKSALDKRFINSPNSNHNPHKDNDSHLHLGLYNRVKNIFDNSKYENTPPQNIKRNAHSSIGKITTNTNNLNWNKNDSKIYPISISSLESQLKTKHCHNTRKKDIAVPSDEPFNFNPLLGPLVPEEEIILVPCKYCDRKFAENRIETHEGICQKTDKRHRNTYDATKYRVAGTDQEKYSFRALPGPMQREKTIIIRRKSSGKTLVAKDKKISSFENKRRYQVPEQPASTSFAVNKKKIEVRRKPSTLK